MLKKNNLWLGIIYGAALPVMCYMLIEALLRLAGNTTFGESTQQVISITANVFLFRMFMLRWNMEETGKGMLLSTLIYAGVFTYYHL